MLIPDKNFATLPTNEIGEEIRTRSEGYWADSLPLQQLTWRQMRAWSFAYGFGNDWFHGTSQIVQGGDQGEMSYVRMGQPGSNLQSLVSQITSPAASLKGQAADYTSETIRATKAADMLLEHVQKNCGLMDAVDQATGRAAMLGEAFIVPEFDEFAGDEVQGVDGKLMRSGDFKFRVLFPWDVKRNPGRPTYELLDYVTAEMLENRYDLAARFPAHEQSILNAPSGPDTRGAFAFGMMYLNATWNHEDLMTRRLMYKPSASVPFGRDVLTLMDGTVLSDGPLAYDMLPIVRIAVKPLDGTPYAYTPFFDILGAAEAHDNLWSAGLTNMMTFGTQLIAFQRGSNPDIMALGGGMSLLPYDPDGKPPEGINLVKMPEFWPQMIQMLQAEMQQPLGQSPITLGQSPGDRAPASLAALQDATSARLAGGFTKSRMNALSMLGKIVLRMFKEHVKGKYNTQIGGGPLSALRWKSISPQDIDGIETVNVDIGNGAQQSAAGRMELANLIQQAKDPEARSQIIEVYTTGNIEPVVQADEEASLRIETENEEIMHGITPIGHPSDDDLVHMKAHNITMNQIDRQNVAAIGAYNDHSKWHYENFYRIDPNLGLDVTTDPNYLAKMQVLMGKVPPPPDPMQIGGHVIPPPAPGQLTQTPPPGQGATPTPSKSPASSGAPSEPPGATQHGIALPAPPKNASTGQPWDPQTGGGTATPLAS